MRKLRCEHLAKMNVSVRKQEGGEGIEEPYHKHICNICNCYWLWKKKD